MNLVHIMLAGSFSEDMSYQDNLLPFYQKKNGHDVTFITTCQKYCQGKVCYTDPCDYVMKNQVRLIRLPFKKVCFSEKIGNKIRWPRGLFSVLMDIKPEWIMIHDPQTKGVYDVYRYIQQHPDTKLVIDSHADEHNSAQNYVSKKLLHSIIYKKYVKKILELNPTFYGVTLECVDFCEKYYDVKKDYMKVLPLGGEIPSEEEYHKNYVEGRAELGISDDCLLIIHSGKLSSEKRTIDLLQMMTKIESRKLCLAIIGSLQDPAVKEKVLAAEKKDSRVLYLGWKTGNELQKYLCAADIYAQPGTQSVTMQSAACCHCALILFPYKSHIALMKETALYATNPEELKEHVQILLNNRGLLRNYQNEVFTIAKEHLDYANQAMKIINN